MTKALFFFLIDDAQLPAPIVCPEWEVPRRRNPQKDKEMTLPGNKFYNQLSPI